MTSSSKVRILIAIMLVVIPPSIQFTDRGKEKAKNQLTKELTIDLNNSERSSAEERVRRQFDDDDDDDWPNNSNDEVDFDKNKNGKQNQKSKKGFVILPKHNVFENSYGKLDVTIRRDPKSGFIVFDITYLSTLTNPIQMMKFVHSVMNRPQ